MKDREADYLRFARDLRVPFSNNTAEQSIRMCKHRIKISGCMRSMTGAKEFWAIRFYLATAVRHGLGTPRSPHPRIPGKPLDPRNRIDQADTRTPVRPSQNRGQPIQLRLFMSRLSERRDR